MYTLMQTLKYFPEKDIMVVETAENPVFMDLPVLKYSCNIQRSFFVVLSMIKQLLFILYTTNICRKSKVYKYLHKNNCNKYSRYKLNALSVYRNYKFYALSVYRKYKLNALSLYRKYIFDTL